MLRRSLALLAGALLAVAPPALADPGPAPTPREYRVLQKLHTDAVSTFLDDGVFTLGSKADVFEGLGTRLAPDTLWFHIDDASKLTVPAGMEFLAPAGSEVWVAPQSNPSGSQLWPGFSTESVPTGAIDGNETTLRLVELEGPGDLELFTTGGFGERTRLWSSDEDISTFRIGRTHMHANWAFTRPGTYALTVEGSAQRGGQTVSDTAVYTFVVGALPPQATTSTSLHVDGPSTIGVGETVELHAQVAPAGANGSVEFRDGAAVLGHEPVVDGDAELETDALGVGTHQLTATFVPKVANLATTSSSETVTVTVTDGSGAEFGLSGIHASYDVGDTLSATVVGYELGTGITEHGQRYRWLLRPVGHDVAGSSVQTSTSTTYSRSPLTLADHDYELSVVVRNCTNASCGTGVDVAQTPWVPIHVAQDGGVAPVLTLVSGNPAELYPGDSFRLEASGLQLADDETAQWVRRNPSGTWSTAFPPAVGVTAGPTWFEATANLGLMAYGDVAVRVLRDGVPVRQSEPISVTRKNFEVMVQGLQGLYMEGAALNVGAQIHPARTSDADVVYKWQFSKSPFSALSSGNATSVVLAEGVGTPPPLAQVLNVADHDGGYLRLELFKPGFNGVSGLYPFVGVSETLRVYVTDDPDAQLFFFGALSAHYHQGDTVNLRLTVAPTPLAGDQIVWEWKWPGGDWAPFPGASGTSYPVTAEQALDGVQVRATLDFAAEGKASIVAEPVTIAIDDHGAAARQIPTIAGATSVIAGGAITLTRELPPNGPTILTQHRWERLAPGAAEWTAIDGETGPELSFAAAPGDDRAQYRVSILKPDGSVAYGPSPAVALTVEPPVVSAEQAVGGTVPALLGLELGSAPSLGTFLPGQARTYTATTTATVTTTLRDAQLTVADPSATATGHLVNGESVLATPLRIAADGGAFAPLTSPLTLRSFPRAVAGEPVPLAFEQAIGAREALEVGAYAKTLTFTLTTTNP